MSAWLSSNARQEQSMCEHDGDGEKPTACACEGQVSSVNNAGLEPQLLHLQDPYKDKSMAE